MFKIRQLFRFNHVYIITGAIIIFSLVVSIFVLLPFAQKTYQLFLEFQSLSRDIDLTKKKLAILESLDEEYLRHSVTSLTQGVPTEKSVASLMTTIEAVASENNISVTELRLGALGTLATDSATQKQSLTNQNISAHIIVSGPYEQYILFLKQLVRVKRLLRVESLRVSLNSGEVTSQLTIEGFYKPLPKSTNTITTEIYPLSQQEEASVNEITALPDYTSLIGAIPTVSFEPRNDPFSP
ncbi:type 4a pilus biogenesis protein PilO [Candidatus Gottesmanbacteria bacterium]|nr:type 4a pilus biogenesis protein PilO [Candidatus Gottesmanbacteria bacterium]